MEIKKIGDLPAVDQPAGHVIIEDGGYAKRVPAAAFANANALDAAAYGIPVLKMTGDVSGMSKDNAVTLSAVFSDYNSRKTMVGKTYYSDWERTNPVGTTDHIYRAFAAGAAACFFQIGSTTYYMNAEDCEAAFEITGNVSCKWQGSSSLAYPKKNYTVVFDAAFGAKAGWDAHDKYVLKANWTDASGIRNLLGAYAWGTCVKSRATAPERLKSLPNGGAIDGFPVWVTINGEDMGLYTMTIPKDAWLFGMTSADTGAGFICAENYLCNKAAAGDESDIEIEYAAGDKAALLASFNNMISVLNSVQSADDLAALEEVLDMESVVDYYAFSAFICNHDGLHRNYIMATYDGIKWFMSAYDLDSTFGNAWDGSSHGFTNDYPSFDIDGSGNKLFVTAKTYYKERIQEVYKARRVWDFGEVNLMSMVCKMAHAMPRVLIMEDYKRWPYRPATNSSNGEQILNFIRLRGPWLDWTVDQM